MLFIGIDISKATFDVAIFNGDTYTNHKYDNNNDSFKVFYKWIKSLKEDIIVCMEATGIYGLLLAKFLHEKNEKIMVINPIKTNAFARMEMLRNKTDKADSQCIARYCKHLYDNGEIEKNIFTPKSEGYEKLQHLNTRLEQLDKMRTQEKNRLESGIDEASIRSVKSLIKSIEKQIKNIMDEVKKTVNKDEKLKEQVDLLVSIKGVGEKTAWSILACIGDISLFSNAKQVTSYAGLNPKIEQSGTTINKSSLSKMGNKRLRTALYMPSLSAIQHNPIIKDLYQRLLKKGKLKMEALCAAMRKLLVLAYGVLKSGKPFDVNYQR
jgi:transposase